MFEQVVLGMNVNIKLNIEQKFIESKYAIFSSGEALINFETRFLMSLEAHSFNESLKSNVELRFFAYADYTKTDLTLESQFRMQMSSNCKSHVINLTKYHEQV